MWKIIVILLTIFDVCICEHGDENRNKQPNIIYIMADDFGWNDVGFRNKDIQTPNIDSLANNGIIFDQLYVQNLCSPSRSALMTGYYPFRTGFQTLVMPLYGTMALPLQFELLPQKLKNVGYSTHMVGKWHLGSCSLAHHPINRGFDTYFGILNAGQYYYTHTTPFMGTATPTNRPGVPNIYDFFNGTDPAWNQQGIYSSVPFSEEVKRLTTNSDKTKPLFLYYAAQLTHCPLQVPQDKIDLYPNIANEARRNFSAMATQLDYEVGNIISDLKENNLYENSIIFFTSDNGGEVGAGGCNYPLKGSKHTLWEGGHRVTAFVHSPLLKRTGYTYKGLTHIVDLTATMLALAGGEKDEDADGMDVWSAITENKKSPRFEMVYQLENHGNNITWSYRLGDFKLIKDMAGLPNYTVLPENVSGLYNNTPGGNIYFKDVPNYPPYRLFDLENDPTENNNLYNTTSYHIKIAELMELLVEHKYKNQMVYPLFRYTQLAEYQQKNNLSLTTEIAPLGINWCEPTQNVQLIDWNTDVPYMVLP